MLATGILIQTPNHAIICIRLPRSTSDLTLSVSLSSSKDTQVVVRMYLCVAQCMHNTKFACYAYGHVALRNYMPMACLKLTPR